MELKIYDKANNLRLTASPNSSSSVTEEIGGECSVSASFTHTGYVPLDVDDYIEVEGVRYKVRSRYRPKQKNTQTYEYSVKFYAPIHDAEDTLMLFQEGGTTSEFSYDGGPREHLQLWIDNMNRRAGGNLWSIGTVITAENKVIDYRNVKCWDAAFGSNGIAATFETEMWADGYVINLCKAERGEVVELGYLQGLTNLAQEDNGEVKFFTRLFPLGSTRNIDATKYGYSRLQLPDRSLYVDKNVDLYGVKEETEEDAFAEIYPQYVGTVSSVRTEEKTSEEGRKYTVYYFKDNGMTWNPKDYQIPDLDYMLQFQTGELAGRGTDGSFQAAWHEDTREWEIINVYPDDTTQIPGGVIIPNPGDKYIPWNFAMPQEYITAAEQAYKQAVDDFLNTYSFDPNKYTGTTDRNYIEKNNTPLRIGWNVRLLSEQYFGSTGGYKDTRITKVQRKLNDLCQATITCSDEVGTGWKSSVDNSLNSLRYEVARQAEQTMIDIIKTSDNKTPSDYNVLSALKAIGMFLRKDKPDSTNFLMRLLGGLISDNIESQDFSSGPFGSGFVVKRDPKTGKSYIEADEIYIRLKAYFDTMEVKHLSQIGGRVVLSPASMECTRVEVISTDMDALYDYNGDPLYDAESSRLYALKTGTRSVSVYRCYFKQSDDTKEIVNEFAVDDLAQCREFNVKENVSQNVYNQYYWRRVVAVGKDYIDLSADDCDAGSLEPKAGDTIVTVGNKTNEARQHVVFLSSYDDDAPCIKLYSGINDYSMLNKEVTVISPNADKNVFTGKVVIKPGSSGFNNFEDGPDFDAINADIEEANKNAQQAINTAENADRAVGDLNDYVDGAFADGIVSESEAKAIEKYINIVNGEKSSSESKYNVLYANPYLIGEAKTNLLNAKISFFGAIDNLISAINAAIEDGRTTAQEKDNVDSKYALYNSAYSDFNKAVEDANESIQNVLKGYSDEAERQAFEASNAASKAQSAANNAQAAVGNLNDYVDGAFSDGIIEKSEAQAIEKYINTVNQTRKEVEATYNALYVNPYLTGTPKTALLNAKVSFSGDVDALIESINTAISDGRTTVAEKNDVDTKYNAFNSSYATLSTAIENANKAIQDKIKELAAQEAYESVKGEIEEVSEESKNDLAQKMGYDNFGSMAAAYEKGETIISGGHVNTKLIEAEAIVTTSLIASAIKTKNLNVNDNFIVDTKGNVTTNNMTANNAVIKGSSVFGGSIETTFVRLSESDAVPSGEKYLLKNQLNIIADIAEIELPVDMSYASKRVHIVNTVTVYTRTDQTSKVSAQFGNIIYGAPLSDEDMLENRHCKQISLLTGIVELVAIPITENYVSWFITNYSAAGFYVKTEESGDIGTVSISGRAVPVEGGRVEGTGKKPVGTKGSIQAIPNSGYRFTKWDDGLTSDTRDVTWDFEKSYVAYFEAIPVAKYKLSLSVSPSGSGSVTGAGDYDEGTEVKISATPNSGYAFDKWSDGDTNTSRYITMNEEKSLTAYFEQHTVSDENIFTNVTVEQINNDGGAFTSLYFNKILVLGNIGSDIYANGICSLNNGYLAGKIKAGLRYRLTLKHYGGDGTEAFFVGIGDLGNNPSETEEWDLVYDGELDYITIGKGTISNPDTFTKEFTARRTSTASDGLFFAGQVKYQVYIKDFELVEI